MNLEKNKVATGYNQWAASYDSMQNKTRDLEATALQQTLELLSFDQVLELGCGTGKNTAWLAQRASSLTAVDFSEQMLAEAKKKPGVENVQFVTTDISDGLPFKDESFSLVTASLVLEHLDDLEPLFLTIQRVLKKEGYFFLAELHPFKQYGGSKARFQSESGTVELPCFVHHTSQFTNAAKKAGLQIVSLNEWFDEENTIPRILSLLFQKT